VHSLVVAWLFEFFVLFWVVVTFGDWLSVFSSQEIGWQDGFRNDYYVSSGLGLLDSIHTVLRLQD